MRKSIRIRFRAAAKRWYNYYPAVSFDLPDFDDEDWLLRGQRENWEINAENWQKILEK
jgi:hypothetical protein